MQNVGDDTMDSDADPATGITQTVTLEAGDNNTDLDAGLSPELASLGDYVWFDENNDGIQDGTESGVEGVSVYLLDDMGGLLDSTLTDVDGLYSFDNLLPGDYAVQFAYPDSVNGVSAVPTMQNVGDDTLDSDADPLTGETQVVTLSAGEHYPDLDAGLSPELASLGDYVWFDENNDGIQDGTEAGVEGVTVYLLDDVGVVLDSTLTDVDGLYSFNNLLPGDYAVQFAYPDSVNGVSVVPSMQNIGDDTLDSDADPLTGETQVVTLEAGENYPDLDAGLSPELASLGDYVWFDENNDGIQDGTESGVEGVSVYLLDDMGGLLDSTLTDVDGLYSFNNLLPGDYAVQFAYPDSVNGVSVVPSMQNIGDDTLDSDADPLTGETQVVTLEAGEHYPDLDAGLSPELANLGDYVWFDENNDGIQDGTESGVEGVTVYLLDDMGVVLDSTMTDVDGLYSFDNLLPGDYAVRFAYPDSVNGVSVVPSMQNIGDDTLDSDADPLTGETQVVTLSAGENYPDLDAGLSPELASLGDYVWFDENNDGIQDGTESGVEGVSVYLLDDMGGLLDSTLTDVDGLYSFNNLLPGDYAVQFAYPDSVNGVSVVPSMQNVGDDTLDSDADPLTGETQVVTLSAGEHYPDLDAGLSPELASLGDYVWFDENNDGIQDGTESGVEGVSVYLLDDMGGLLDSTLTDVDGLYSFDNLLPGDYAVQFAYPDSVNGVSVVPSMQNVGDDTLDSDADPLTGETQVVTLSAGEHYPDLDAGLTPELASLGDVVWLDWDSDGLQEAGETVLPNITIYLLDASGERIDSTTSDSGGLYRFGDLLPGDYAVEFAWPDSVAGMAIAPSPQDSGDDTLDSDADPTTFRTQMVTLIAGEHYPHLDAGVVPQIIDLSLIKTVDNPNPYVGELVTFSIEIKNSSPVNATGVAVEDYLPNGLEFVTDLFGGATIDGSIVSWAGLSIAPYDSVTISYTAEVLFPDMGITYDNVAEIVAADQEDIDSTPDNGADTDRDGDIGSEDDNPNDQSEDPDDEDDGDNEPVAPQYYDLALTKSVVTPAPYAAGDIVTYRIYIFNQGTVTAAANTVIIQDYVPAGMTIVDPDWIGPRHTLSRAILSGGVDSVDVDIRINADFEGSTLVNNAEILIDGGDDIDSQTGDNANDPPDIANDDSLVDGNGDSDVQDPQDDDYDPAVIVVNQSFDLALRKEVKAGAIQSFAAGDMVTFDITVYNQGTITATDVVLHEYVPSAMTIVDSDWATNQYTIDEITAGDSVTVEVTLQISEDYMGGALVNNVEIISADNELDLPDEDGDLNDVQGSVDDDSELDTDDDIDDEAPDTPGIADNPDDQDDYDPAVVEVVDLALIKRVIDQAPYQYGDTLEFIISVINQGSIPVQDVEISDYLPAGFTFDSRINDGWSFAPSGYWANTYRYTITDIIEPLQTYNVSIYLILNPAPGVPDAYVNIAEVLTVRDTAGVDRTMDDLDSMADADPTNDPGGVIDGESDDTVDGDGSGEIGEDDQSGDEDNADPVKVEIVDFALKKETASEGPFFVGEEIPYVITIINQGNVTSSGILIYDYIPAGLDFLPEHEGNRLWKVVDDQTISTFVDVILAPGESTTTMVYMTPNGEDYSMEGLTNNAEIVDVFNVLSVSIASLDVDSTPDGINGNDSGGEVNTTTDNTVNNENGDEDDADAEDVCVPEDISCPATMTMGSCLDQAAVDAAFMTWLAEFSGGGCGITGRFISRTEAPLACGGSVDIIYQLYDQMDRPLDGMSCTATFTVLGDTEGPTCPGDFDIDYIVSGASCILPAYTSVAQLTAQTGAVVTDECTPVTQIGISYVDQIVPEECDGTNASGFFDSRDVVRTYTFSDECGNTTECDQLVTYHFTECNQLSDYGRISIGGSTVYEMLDPSIEVCSYLPTIGEERAPSGLCGYVEHMWLRSTLEKADGSPYIPNSRNMGPEGSGAIWEIITGAVDATYTPTGLTQNTYFVRCSRNFGCCAYGESNLVGYRISNTVTGCPVDPDPIESVDDCSDEILMMASPTDDSFAGESLEYRTSATIEASNKVGTGSQLLYSAESGTTLLPGFEVATDAQLEVTTDGCNRE